MKCMVIKASPRGAKASSSRVADAFIKGLESTGADITEIMLKDRNIKHCTGCYSCWTRTPGRCIHRDDMDVLLPEFDQADLIVYVFPLYYFSVPGQLKDFMDRGLPMLKPDLVPGEDRTSHPRRNEKEQRIVLISTAGFPEKTVFSAVERLFEAEVGNQEEFIAGRILIPGAEMLHQDDYQESCEEFYGLIGKAGREVGEGRKIPEELIGDIDAFQQSRLGTSEEFSEIANAYWASLQTETGAPVEYADVSPVKGDSLCSLNGGGMETLMAGMGTYYNPEVKPGLKAVLQFDFDGDGYYLVVSGSDCQAYKGFHSQPSVTVISPADVWEAIAEGSLSGAEGLLNGKYKVEGDMALFMKMDSLFSSEDQDSAETSNVSKNADIKKGRGPLKLSGGLWMTLAFLPWMILWIGPVLTSSPWISYGALSLSGLLCLYHLMTNKLTLFEGGTLVYMIVQVLFTRFPAPVFTQGSAFFQYLFLAMLWGGSLTMRFSLTGEYIRNDFPKSVWNLPSFRDTNRILTAVWAVYYCIAAFIRYLEVVSGTALWMIITPYVLLVPMFVFTGWFQKWYPARLMGRKG